MSAKFIAQIEMSSSWVPRYSEPADATRPRIVSISGRPAATSEPNASTRMSIVTGHEMTSLLSIAERLASLKSDHMPDAPLSDTCTPSAPRSLPFRSSAARTMSFGFAAAPAWMMAVWPSREIDRPGRGGTTPATRGSAASVRWAAEIAPAKAGSSTVRRGACTTTCRALEDRPRKLRSASSRACTDSEPVASQPAPDSACSTRGASAPRPSATTAHAIATARTWVAV